MLGKSFGVWPTAGIDLGARFCLQPGVNVTSGQPLSRLSLRSVQECQDACQAANGCEHFNYEIGSDASNTGFGSCTLLQGTTSGASGFVQTEVGAAFVSGPAACQSASVVDIAGVRDTAGAVDSANPLAAQFSDPAGLRSWHDQLFVADSGNHLIRQMDMSTGAVTAMAGTGSRGFSAGDDSAGAALSRTLDAPHAVEVNALGQVYFTDSINNRSLGCLSMLCATAREDEHAPAYSRSGSGCWMSRQACSPPSLAQACETLPTRNNGQGREASVFVKFSLYSSSLLGQLRHPCPQQASAEADNFLALHSHGTHLPYQTKSV